jgi:hypothetical protein
MADNPQNFQWVKPIMPGDVPEGMKPVWNSETESWDHVIHEDHPINVAAKIEYLKQQIEQRAIDEGHDPNGQLDTTSSILPPPTMTEVLAAGITPTTDGTPNP